jgi:hypothetical protein
LVAADSRAVALGANLIAPRSVRSEESAFGWLRSAAIHNSPFTINNPFVFNNIPDFNG